MIWLVASLIELALAVTAMVLAWKNYVDARDTRIRIEKILKKDP